MNTLLDGNKMLFLTNGERIPIPNSMRLIFEVPDLNAATPATVSRCGMIFLDSNLIGWKPLVVSWTEGLRPELRGYSTLLLNSCMSNIGDIIQFMSSSCVFPLSVSWNQLVRSLLNILDCYLEYFSQVPSENPISWVPESSESAYRDLYTVWTTQEPFMKKALLSTTVEKKIEIIEHLFVFALVWSFGAVVDQSSRLAFDSFLR
jgi:dynein heavy chain